MSVAILVNLRSKRGSVRFARALRELWPKARLATTRTLEEARRFVRETLAREPPSLLLAAGGDGTAASLLTELRAGSLTVPAFGVLPLGTGNAWARSTGCPSSPLEAVRRLTALNGKEPPLRHFNLVETEGRVAPFAGTGWDAEVIHDYQAHLASQLPIARKLQKGMLGYLTGLVTRTIPRHLFRPSAPHVTLTNLGESTLTVDAAGRVLPVAGGGEGAVLYRGPASIAAAATTSEFGFGLRAFPFAERVPDRLSVRAYAASVLEAARRAPELWRGAHPIPKMHDFFLTHGRMEFDREVPFQIAGDLAGMRRSIEFRIDTEGVNVIDWNQLHA
ncbi:MAG: diacylglycerol/lipid kinase family protein [Myxococcaceae bacterium]